MLGEFARTVRVIAELVAERTGRAAVHGHEKVPTGGHVNVPTLELN
jgi:hypothetical protein